MSAQKKKYTLKEVADLLKAEIPRYRGRLTTSDNDGFAMGEKNMAQIVDSFLNKDVEQ